MSKRTEEMTAAFKQGDDIRDAGLKTPRNVRRFDDIVYGEDPENQIMDLYVPRKKNDGKWPVIISIHGGGWFYGDKERYQYYCMSLVQHGFAVINFTYRLAPKFKFPSPLEDTNLVVEWLMANGAEYGLDTERVFFVGDSAGGQLNASYAAICTNPKYAKLFKFKVPEGFKPRAIGLNCGVYTHNTLFNGLTKDILEEDYLPRHGSKKEQEMMSAAEAVTEDFPPTFLLSGAQDYLRDEQPIMAKVLVDHKVPMIMRIYSDNQQDLNHVFHCDMRLSHAHKANKDQCDFFKEYL